MNKEAKKTTQLTDTEVEQLLAQFGVQFVNRSYGKATKTTVTLDCFTKAINFALQKDRGE